MAWSMGEGERVTLASLESKRGKLAQRLVSMLSGVNVRGLMGGMAQVKPTE